MNNLKEFLSTNKKIIIISFTTLFILYCFKFFFYSFSIDTEIFINDRKELLNSWIAIDRSGLVLMKYIFDIASKSLILANIVSFLLNFLTTIIYLYIFQIIFKDKNSKFNNEKNLYFILIFLTSPFLIEQYNFTLQNVEISIALLLSAINMYFIDKVIRNKNILYGIISTLITGFVFSCYQSFILLFIMESIIIFIAYFKDEQISFSKCFKVIVKLIIILVLSFVICRVINYLFLNFTDLNKSSYLNSNFMWGNEPIIKCVLRIGYLIAKMIFYPSIFNIFFIIIYFFSWIYYVKKNNKNQNWFKLVVICSLFLTPFLIIIFTANTMAYRAHISIAFLMAFSAYYLIDKFNLNKLIRLVSLLIIIFQSIITGLLFYSDYLNFKEEENLTYQIEKSLSNYDINNKSIIFVGARNSHDSILTGETIGKSFFEWDYYDTPYKSNNRIKGFIQALDNYSYLSPSVEEIDEADQYKNDLEIFPSNNSILEKEKYIIIRLN